MHLFFVTLILIVFANISYSDRVSKSSIELPHPRYSTVGNPTVPHEYDCALRAFGIEMAAYIAPASLKARWTSLESKCLSNESMQ